MRVDQATQTSGDSTSKLPVKENCSFVACERACTAVQTEAIESCEKGNETWHAFTLSGASIDVGSQDTIQTNRGLYHESGDSDSIHTVTYNFDVPFACEKGTSETASDKMPNADVQVLGCRSDGVRVGNAAFRVESDAVMMVHEVQNESSVDTTGRHKLQPAQPFSEDACFQNSGQGRLAGQQAARTANSDAITVCNEAVQSSCKAASCSVVHVPASAIVEHATPTESITASGSERRTNTIFYPRGNPREQTCMKYGAGPQQLAMNQGDANQSTNLKDISERIADLEFQLCTASLPSDVEKKLRVEIRQLKKKRPKVTKAATMGSQHHM
eukprot:TRINITY_DN21318_c0_g1_i1.p1 TRINITY_DN21318_c0_g1~~TRINITY_DN21318_c0_g1_i1.p1  ORF type:complete len:366 (-),score=51.96 TRINITY_DN21318_c0_g1_i1:127-1113(-)